MVAYYHERPHASLWQLTPCEYPAGKKTLNKARNLAPSQQGKVTCVDVTDHNP